MLLGVALSSWAGSLPVCAQESASSDMTIKDEVLSDNAVRQMFGEEALKDPESIPDPMPLSYPYASPGGLDMRHWTDYTKTETRPGSASDVRFYKNKMLRIDLDENGRVMRPNTPLYYRRSDTGPQRATYYDIDRTTAYYDVDVYSRPAGMASNSDYIYMVRGNTLYQLRTSDMSVAMQKDMPMMDMSGTSATTGTDTGAAANTQTPSDMQMRMRRRWMMRPVSLSLSGDNLFLLRGNTLYQYRASDLSLVTQKELPPMTMPNAPETGTSAQPGTSETGTDTSGSDTGGANH
jgi:hypothetical protein